MTFHKSPIDYASPRPRPLPLGRQSRRRRREAFQLLVMTGVFAAAAGGSFLYGLATGALNDRGGGHTLITLSIVLATLAAVFGLFAGARYLESRGGD